MAQQWNPLQDLVVLQDRMNRLFEDATQRRSQADAAQATSLSAATGPPPLTFTKLNQASYSLWTCRASIVRRWRSTSEDNRLIVKGTRTIDESKQYRTERPRGKFLRTFSVPGSVDQSRIGAEYKDGVLQIRLPKRSEQKPKKIDIKIS